MRNMVRMSVLVVLTLAFTLSLSATTLHMSQGLYYFDGTNSGSSFTCLGLACPTMTFSLGTPSGPALFEIDAQVDFDGANTTYSYALKNFVVDAGLTGLAIGVPGLTGTEGSPNGWFNFQNTVGLWQWLCTPDAQSGACDSPALPNGDPVQIFSMTLPGLVEPEFKQVAVSLGMGNALQTIALPDWNAAAPGQQTTATPEPGSLMLLASGLLGGAYFVRRKK